MTIPQCKSELERHQERLKEANDYPTKLAALQEVIRTTATYLSMAYEETPLHDYRSLEKMARKALRLAEENLAVPERYYEQGQTWRATIALNSIGLDFFIIQSKIEGVLTEAGKYTEALADNAPSHPLLSRVRRRLKPLLGHHRPRGEFSMPEVTDRIENLV
ncbi:MAG: hypothetical protein R6W94_09155 [Spirochaetia bacterium]